MSSHKLTVEKPKAKFRVKVNGQIHWVRSIQPIKQWQSEFGNDAVEFEKYDSKYKATITHPSGKKATYWFSSYNSVLQLAAEYVIPASAIRWVQMK